MIATYPVIFTQTNDGKNTYLVYIPDLDGATEGYGIADAIHMARDYIGSILYDKDEGSLPQASALSEINVENSEFADEGHSIISIVDVDIDADRRLLDNKPVRRNVSLPNWLNQAANKANINVSRVLQDALKEKLQVGKKVVH